MTITASTWPNLPDGHQMRAIDIEKQTQYQVLPKIVRNDDYIDGMLNQTIVELERRRISSDRGHGQRSGRRR